jgi:hypothetical protein
MPCGNVGSQFLFWLIIEFLRNATIVDIPTFVIFG